VVVRERLYAPFSVGDLRVSPFVGGAFTGYYDRTDGGEDLTRAALEAGVRANLQFHRDFEVLGGPWALDGLRHVIDADLEAYGRFLDSTDADEAPFFDRVEPEEDRTEVALDLRSRWETRRAYGKRRQNVPVADVRVRAAWWPDGIGPYGRRGPGEVQAWGVGEVSPRRVWVAGGARVTLEDPALERGVFGVLAEPTDDLWVAAGVSQVRDEVLAPWVDAYWRWSPKWAARLGVLYDLEDADVRTYRLTFLRFSADHVFQFGLTVSDAGEDVGLFVDFLPAVDGEPLRSPFDPRETVEVGP
jgi:hypothetical protein